MTQQPRSLASQAGALVRAGCGIPEQLPKSPLAFDCEP